MTEFESNLRDKLARPQIPSLNGIRAVAVLLVILYHYGLPVPGAHGVLIFFVLSGFLITWLLLREQEQRGSVSLRGFYRRRMLRIFPAFYFYWAVLIALLVVTGKHVLWPHAISALVYLSDYYNAAFGDPNNGLSHTWSLAIEEQFYVLWPALFIWFRRDLRSLTIVLASLIGAVWAYRLILCLVFHVDQAYIYAAFDTRMDSLMMGCLVAVLLKRGALMSVWRRACHNGLVPLCMFALLAVSAVEGPSLLPRYRDLVGLAVDPVLVAVLMVQAIALSTAPYFAWLEWPAMRFLGRISYSLYLWQQLTLSLAHSVIRLPAPLHFAVAMTVTVLAAAMSHYFIERPFLKLKDRPRSASLRQTSTAIAPQLAS
jgi:peptidoglycan/LPS O-acetylase OafA/YrhL